MCKKANECQELGNLEDGENWIVGDDECYLVYKTNYTTDVTAEEVFFSWYNLGKEYVYTQEPTNDDAGRLIIVRSPMLMP